MDPAQNPPSDKNQSPSAPPEIAPLPQFPEITPPPVQPEISPPPTLPEIPVQTVTTSSVTPPPQPKKFPFMLVTIILGFVIAGFGGSFLYFRITAPKKQAVITKPLITPPATFPPATPTTVVNPFASPSGSLVNPFVSPTTKYENPFGSSQNPFAQATNSANTENQPVKNPFE